MRHRISGRQLGRTINERHALYRSQLHSLFSYGFIKTTSAKAKSIVPLAEKIAAAAVKADLNSRRYIFTFFQDRNMVNRIVSAFSTTFAGQSSNFTQMSNVKLRYGDNALIVKLSFVKAINTLPVVKKDEKKEDKKSAKVEKVKKIVKKTPVKDKKETK